MAMVNVKADGQLETAESEAVEVDDDAPSKEPIVLPEPPGKLVEYDDAEKWLESLNDRQRGVITVYLYRSSPKILREQDPNNLDDNGKAIKYIDCYYEAFTKDDIASMHGGGKYTLWINDTGSSNRARKQPYFKARLHISTDEVDPILNLAELDWNCKENQPYINKMRALGKIQGKEYANPMTHLPGGVTSGEHSMTEKLLSYVLSKDESEREQLRRRNPDNVVLEQALAMANKGSERSLDFMVKQLENTKKDNPADWLSAMSTMVQAILSNQGKGNDNTLLVAMMQNQMETTKLMVEMATRRPEKEEGSGDDLDRLSKLLNIATMIKGGRATVEGGWIDKAIEHGLPVLGQVVQGIREGMALRRGVPMQRGPMPGQPNPNQQQQNRVNPSVPVGWSRQAELQAANTPEPQPQQPQQNPGQPSATPGQQYILEAGQLILNKMADPGDSFAELISAMYGPTICFNIQQIGKEQLLADMKSIPEFWNTAMNMYKPERVEKWIDDFLKFDPYQEDDGEGEEGETE